MKSICIIKHRGVQLQLDSDIYTDFYNYELPLNLKNDYQELEETLLYIQESDITDILFVSNNDLYYFFALAMKNIFTKRRVKMFIIPEYKLSWLNQNYLVEDLYLEVDYQKPRLPQYQVHLTDICNLNCKGCGHFCNIADSPNFLDLEVYKQDILKLKEKFWGVRWIYLLGGEPLLHNKVYEFIQTTREVFPDADIRLTTNGLLLPNMAEVFWKAVRKNHIHIEISQYKKTREKWKVIQQALFENDVQASTLVQPYKERFFKQRVLLPLEDAISSFQNCISRECHYLRNGKLYLCPCVPLNQIFYNYFKIGMPYVPEGIDLYDSSLDGWDILSALKEPNEACKYCSNDSEWFDWEVRLKKDASVEDWVINRRLNDI